jgi:putative DNA primase/helicase
VLTFQGAQGIGKTRWVLSLVPDDSLREMLVKDGHHLDAGNKDSILGAVTHWIVELGELDSTFKKDMARLKGFLTSDFDKIRRPYARTESEYPRRTVFFASVNQADFLVDATGNTRWWTIPVTKINYKHGIDMQQLFAQLAVDFRKGKEWWLNQHDEVLLEHHNRDHRSVSVIRERLMEMISPESTASNTHPAMSSIEVLRELGYETPTNQQCKECAAILREQFGNSVRIRGINKWHIPLKGKSHRETHQTWLNKEQNI